LIVNCGGDRQLNRLLHVIARDPLTKTVAHKKGKKLGALATSPPGRCNLHHPASKSRRRVSTPWQEHQVGCFLGVIEERLTRRAHQFTHRQTAGKVEDMSRARGNWEVWRSFSGADPRGDFSYRL
jgi:hypothetical protein